MGIFGFTWADGGAFVGGALGAAFFGPPGAMLGSAVGSFAGGALGDDKSAGAAFEEALVAGIGAAGGAWATNLGGNLLKDGITSAATKTLSANAAQRVDGIASRALLPWNKHGGGPVAAFGGAFGGYEVSTQARPLVQVATTDIGNGGCPAQMSNLRMPAGLTGSVGELYIGLPGYLCEVWRGFGTGTRKAPPAPKVPKEMDGVAASGIAGYRAKARRLDTVMAGFADLDARAVALIGRDSERISREGRLAVGSLIDTVNTRAAQTPAEGVAGEIHAMDLLDAAFGRGREILSQAVTASDRVAAEVDDLSKELKALRDEFADYREEHEREHPPGGRPVLPPAPVYPLPPGTPAPMPAPTPGATPGTASAPGTPATGAASGTSQPPGTEVGPGAGTSSGVPDSSPASGTETPGPVGVLPTPWAQRPGTDSAAAQPGVSRIAAPEAASGGVTSADRATRWTVPSYVPAGWSGAEAAGAAPAGPRTAGPQVAGSQVAAPAGRTPWTDLAAVSARSDHGALWASGPVPPGTRSGDSGARTKTAETPAIPVESPSYEYEPEPSPVVSVVPR
ncbi:hypothetical protein [Nocardia sp. NPDC003345]